MNSLQNKLNPKKAKNINRYIELFKKYNELWATYELCDPNFDYDIVTSLEAQIESLENEILSLEKKIFQSPLRLASN